MNAASVLNLSTSNEIDSSPMKISTLNNNLNNLESSDNQIARSLDAINNNNQTNLKLTNMSYSKAEDERINENLNKHEQSSGISSDMLFGNRKVDEQFSNKLDKMSSFTAIGSDMMKKNGVNSGNNEESEAKDQIISM